MHALPAGWFWCAPMQNASSCCWATRWSPSIRATSGAIGLSDGDRQFVKVLGAVLDHGWSGALVAVVLFGSLFGVLAFALAMPCLRLVASSFFGCTLRIGSVINSTQISVSRPVDNSAD